MWHLVVPKVLMVTLYEDLTVLSFDVVIILLQNLHECEMYLNVYDIVLFCTLSIKQKTLNSLRHLKLSSLLGMPIIMTAVKSVSKIIGSASSKYLSNSALIKTDFNYLNVHSAFWVISYFTSLDFLNVTYFFSWTDVMSLPLNRSCWSAIRYSWTQESPVSPEQISGFNCPLSYISSAIQVEFCQV